MVIIEPIVEPVIDPRDEAIEKLRLQIEYLQSRIDAYGEQVIAAKATPEVIQGSKGSGKNENPALEYFK